MGKLNKMHTFAVVFGVIVNVLFALALISIIVGVVWIFFPLTNRVYITDFLYEDLRPMGGRITGLIMLIFGLISMVCGFLMDDYHSKLMKRYGARI